MESQLRFLPMLWEDAGTFHVISNIAVSMETGYTTVGGMILMTMAGTTRDHTFAKMKTFEGNHSGNIGIYVRKEEKGDRGRWIH